MVNLQLRVNPVYDTVINAEIIEGESYTLNSNPPYTEAGTYYDTLQTVNGCDSTFMLNLLVHLHVRTEFTAEICQGDTYDEQGFTATESGTYTQEVHTVNGADSLVILNLTVHPVYNDTITAEICQGETYNQFGFTESTAGFYTQQLQTINGCDSVVNLQLRVNPVYDTTLYAQICQGESYTFHSRTLTEAGIYTDTLSSVKSCDSIVHLNLTVNPVYEVNITDSICAGETYTLYGFNAAAQGHYTQNLTSIHGCDSVVNLDLRLISFTDTIYADICEGDTYNQFGFTETQTGIYVDSLQSWWGCDSIVVLNLRVHQHYYDTIVAQTCDNIPYTQFGFNADTTGYYTQSLQSIYGCDSIVTLVLTVYPTYVFPLNEEICEGEVYIEHGFWLTSSGVHVMDSYTSCHGCDSIYTLNLTVNPTYDQLVEVEICQGDTFRYEGYNNIVAWTPGTYRDVIQTVDGCDSAKTIMLSVRPVFNDTIYATICEGEVYNQYGFLATEAGVYTQTLYSHLGCDSVSVLNLSVNPSYLTALAAEICEGEQYGFAGMLLTEEGVYNNSLRSVHGCDSIVQLTLRVNHHTHDTIHRRTCLGTNYVDENFNIGTSGTYTVEYNTHKGCDSTITLVLETIYYNDTVSAVICEGDVYTDHGFNVSQEGEYVNNYHTYDGCDSILVLQLQVEPLYNDTIFAEINYGDYYQANGFLESESGTYSQYLLSEYGCDSLTVLQLHVEIDEMLFVPDAITPQDNSNHHFAIYVENENLQIDEVVIYNRNGELVFHTKDPSVFWDGKYKGQYVPQGVYKYAIIYHDITTPDEPQRRVGSVMVLY